MKEVIGLIRAKSPDKGNPDADMSLAYHTAELLKELEIIENYLRQNQENMEYEFKHGMDETIKALSEAIFIHDLGKIYLDFQKKVWPDKYNNDKHQYTEQWNELSSFLKGTETNYEVRHEVLSTVWSAALLGNEEMDWWIRTAILLHHANSFYIGKKDFMEIVGEYEEEIKRYANFLKSIDMKVFLKDFLALLEEKGAPERYLEHLRGMIEKMDADTMYELYQKIDGHDEDISELAEFYDIENQKPDYDFLVFLGILRRCDYSASGGMRIEEETDLSKVFDHLDERIKGIIKVPEIWQEEVLSKKFSKRMILVAPTGSGKTEFALLWAQRTGRKFIYTLPLRVALNDIYDRFKGKDGKELLKRDHFSILHSTAFIEYIKDSEGRQDLDTETKVNTSKLFSYPIMLTTPDQIFLTSLNYYGSDKVISIYPQSAVLIDEIQAYDPEMAAIIIKTLRIIEELRGNLLIITATWPPYYEKFLGKETVDISDSSLGLKSEVKNLKRKRHRIELFEKPFFEIELEDNKIKDVNVSEYAKKKIKDIFDAHRGENKLIIVNNVSKAIKLYDHMKDTDYAAKDVDGKSSNVFLLHSRMIEKEKSKVITNVRKRMEENRDAILVSTQMVEASVDLDFDILITEISPIDSQIQRWGRVYRSRDKDYNSEKPNIYVFGAIDRLSGYIYDSELMGATIDVIKNNQGRTLKYADEKNMINETFEKTVDGKKLKEKYEEKISKILENLDYFTVEKRSEAQRLFRKIAGFKFVVPELMKKSEHVKKSEDAMKNSEGEVERVLGEIISNPFKQSITWEKIIEEIESKTGKKKDKWELRKILYEYSFNMPAYYFEKMGYHPQFKDFYILDLKPEDAEKLREKGFDAIKDDILSVDKMGNIL